MLRPVLRRAIAAFNNKQVLTLILESQTRPRIFVYFNGSKRAFYQLEPWLPVFESLARELDTVVVLKSLRFLARVRKRTSLPIWYVPEIAELERKIYERQIDAIFYVNQHVSNFAVLRFTGPVHVFLNHGESEKSYMVTNQVRAYDFIFVAGPAAKKRLLTHVRYVHEHRLIEIGRPILQPFGGASPTHEPDGTRTYLYAPTWEGDRDSARYSSVLGVGSKLVEFLLNRQDGRLIYRPHPQLGRRSHAYRRIDRRIRRAISLANLRLGRRLHVVDDSDEYGWQIRTADHVFADMSSVFFDALALGKDVLLCPPDGEKVWIGEHSPLSVPIIQLNPCRDLAALDLFSEVNIEAREIALTELAGEYFSCHLDEHRKLFLHALRQVVGPTDGVPASGIRHHQEEIVQLGSSRGPQRVGPRW